MDSFFGIGISELFMIAIVALIVLGPERLPKALREVANVIKTVRKMMNELTSQFGDEFKALEDLNPQKLLRELTEDPDEKANAAAKTAAAAKPAAPKPATPAPKPVATTPKPVTPKAEPVAAASAATSKSTTVATPAAAIVAPAEEVTVSVDAPAEPDSAVNAPVASNEEPSIMPPALREQALAESTDAAIASETAMPPIEANVEVNEAEPVAAASIIEGQAIGGAEPSVSEPTENLAETLANTALETAPEKSSPEIPSQEFSGEEVEAADIVNIEGNVEAASMDTTTVDIPVVDTVAAELDEMDTGDTDGSEKAAGEVSALPTRSYAKSASINGTHVNGNSKENEA